MKMKKLNLKFLRKLVPRRRDSPGDGAHDRDLSDNDRPHDRSQSRPQSRATLVIMTPEEDGMASTTSTKKFSQAPAPAPAQPPAEDCPICHDPVGLRNPEGIVETWTELHCGHKFGSHCIQTWLQESVDRDMGCNPTCPICRDIARHPCGHLVSPLATNTIFAGLYDIPPPTPPPRRRHAYRLTRRFGHPRRPVPSITRRMAQNVGECQTCAANALFDARMKQWSEGQENQEAGSREAQSSRSDTNRMSLSGGRSLVLFPGLKRQDTTRHSFLGNEGPDSYLPGGPEPRINIRNCRPAVTFQLLHDMPLSISDLDHSPNF